MSSSGRQSAFVERAQLFGSRERLSDFFASVIALRLPQLFFSAPPRRGKTGNYSRGDCRCCCHHLNAVTAVACVQCGIVTVC